MITRSFLTALAAGLLSVAAGASFAQADTAHVYRGGPKTVVTDGWAGARGESGQITVAAFANDHRYYGGPKNP
jgi:hypothetical protein